MRLLPYNSFVTAILILSLVCALAVRFGPGDIRNTGPQLVRDGVIITEFVGLYVSLVSSLIYSGRALVALVNLQWIHLLWSTTWVVVLILFTGFICYLEPMFLYAT